MNLNQKESLCYRILLTYRVLCVHVFVFKKKKLWQNLHQFSSVAQLCPTLCDPMDCSMPGLPVHHQLSELSQTHELSQRCHLTCHLILCGPLLLLPSIFPSIRVFSSELVLCIR